MKTYNVGEQTFRMDGGAGRLFAPALSSIVALGMLAGCVSPEATSGAGKTTGEVLYLTYVECVDTGARKVEGSLGVDAALEQAHSRPECQGHFNSYISYLTKRSQLKTGFSRVDPEVKPAVASVVKGEAFTLIKKYGR